MGYDRAAAEKLSAVRSRGECLTLCIETSCDETAAAVTLGFKALSGSVHSQISLHGKYGGVVPEIASRSHVKMLDYVVKDALVKSGKTPDDIEAVAVTYGPGLVGALLCGVSYAKALAFSKNLPIIPINHIEGHLCSNYLEHDELKPPFLCLAVSGGHSHLILAEDGGYRLIGKTIDDAAGEAFDKAARVLGLPYPGGAMVEALAKGGDPTVMPLPKPKTGGYNYTFSGLKTAFAQGFLKSNGIRREDAAAAFQQRVVGQLADKALLAALDLKIGSLALAGGVAANGALRNELSKRCAESGVRFFAPPVRLCSDNAEMIGAAAHLAIQSGRRAGLELNAEPSLRLV